MARPTFAHRSEPIRAELFGVERLEERARDLAETQATSKRRGRLRLISKRLSDNGDVLLASYRELADAVGTEALLTPAADWLVDNFHLVERQLREIRENLPSSYYHELPKLAGGDLAGYPRVFEIAWVFVAHLDSRFDSEALERFVDAYQTVEPLTIGELWALPITLRVVLLENLRRSAEGIVEGRRLRRRADELADGLLGVGDGRSADAEANLDRIGSGDLPQPFVVQLIKRLRDHDPETTPGLRWLLDRLAAEGTTPDEAVAETQHRQVATNLTVRNIVTSFRHISSFEWAKFVERVSLADRALAEEGSYLESGYETRDRYRHAIEDLSKRSGAAEFEVAEAALRLAGAQLDDRRQHDPGYYLLGEGRYQLEAEVGFRPGLGLTFARLVKRNAAVAMVDGVPRPHPGHRRGDDRGQPGGGGTRPPQGAPFARPPARTYRGAADDGGDTGHVVATLPDRGTRGTARSPSPR